MKIFEYLIHLKFHILPEWIEFSFYFFYKDELIQDQKSIFQIIVNDKSLNITINLVKQSTFKYQIVRVRIVDLFLLTIKHLQHYKKKIVFI